MDAYVKPKRAVLMVLGILSCSFALRVSAAVWWQARLPAGVRFAFGDSESYWSLAKSIANGQPYQYGPGGARIFRTPGYPLLLAPLFVIRDEPPVLWARVCGAGFGTLAVGLMMWIACELFSFRAALLAGTVGTIYPGAIAASILVLSEAPYCPLLLLQIACWIRAARSPNRQALLASAVVGGLAAGAATLVRPSHLLFTPFALLLAMLASSRRRNLVIGVAMFVGLCVALAPWCWRNYRLTGRFVATSLQMGASLYDGLSPEATGASDMRFVEDFVEQQRRSDAASVNPPPGTFEERLDQRLKDAAIQWALDHPEGALRLAATKLFRMWSPLPHAREFQNWVFRIAIFATFTPLLIAAAYGVWRFAPCGWPYALCAVPALYLTLLHMVFVSSIRYREPAMLPLIVLAAGVWFPTDRKQQVD